MEFEEHITKERLLEETDDNLGGKDDDVDGWIDEMAALSQAECDVLKNATHPVKIVLVKVSGRNQISMV